MERFMFIFRDEPRQAMPSPAEMEASMQVWLAWIERLRKAGQYEGGEPLLPAGKQIKDSRLVVTDGPFIESKELVSGYFIVLAKDLNQAADMAKESPNLKVHGTVEIRPIQKM